MLTRDRLVISALALLAVLNVTLLLGRSPGLTAVAEASPAPGPDAATTVELRSSKDGEAPLVLRNEQSRLAWGTSPHDRAYSIAFVHTGKILEKLMESEALSEDRDRLVADLEATETKFREELEGITDRLQKMDPESDEARRVYQEGSEVYGRYMEWQQKALTERGKLDAQHLESAYRELIAAVEVVASRRKIDLVYRFIPTGEKFEAEDPEQAMNAIRLRSALVYPEKLDITDLVIEELSLTIE